MTSSLSLPAIAKALGGAISGHSVLAPGPGHHPWDRSLSITLCTKVPIGFLMHSFAGDDPRVCKDYIRAKLGLPPFAPQRKQPARAPWVIPTDVNARAVNRSRDNQELATGLWRIATDPRGTLVEQYLKSRAIELPEEAANEAIRFHPLCQFGRERFPAMVCLIRNIETNEHQGIHRTALTQDGTAIKRDGKTYRLSLGHVTNGAIKLDPDEDVTQGLCIGEGVETCLSGRQMGLRPVWSVLNTSGIARFPILPGIEGLYLFKENDANGASNRPSRRAPMHG